MVSKYVVGANKAYFEKNINDDPDGPATDLIDRQQKVVC